MAGMNIVFVLKARLSHLSRFTRLFFYNADFYENENQTRITEDVNMSFFYELTGNPMII